MKLIIRPDATTCRFNVLSEVETGFGGTALNFMASFPTWDEAYAFILGVKVALKARARGAQ